MYAVSYTPTGAFTKTTGSSPMTGTGGGFFRDDTVTFNSGLLGANYSGSDTHPLNISMTPAIFLGV
jgi:hypothetical protein